MKKITVLIVVFFGFIALSTQQALAQSSIPEPTLVENYSVTTTSHPPTEHPTYQNFLPRLDQNVEPNLRVLTQSVMIEVLAAISCQLSGYDPLEPEGRCLGINPLTREVGQAPIAGGGAVGLVARATSSTYQLPVSGSQYVSYLASNFGVTEKVYAQEGIGFPGLSPVLGVWTVFRNLVYLAFVLIFAFIGIGIMFRIKMDPRTVMTIQNQIPKIIVGLILVTFSYAIAGFMIDMMFVLIYLILNLGNEVYLQAGLGTADQPGLHQTTFGFVNDLYSPDVPVFGNSLGIMSIVWNASAAVSGLIVSLFVGFIDTTIGKIFSAIPIFSIMDIACEVGKNLNPVNWVLNPHSTIIGDIPVVGDFTKYVSPGYYLDKIPVVNKIPGIGGQECSLSPAEIAESFLMAVVGTLAFVIILVAVLFSLFRLWFTLIKAFIFLLLDVVFAPFWIAMGLLPGNNLGFGAWVRDMISNLIPFPTVIAMFLLGKIFIDAFGSSSRGDEFIPPLVGTPGDQDIIGGMIGLGFILITPQVVDQVKKFLKTPSPNFPALGAAIGVGTGTVSRPAGKVGQKTLWGKDERTGNLAPLRGWIAGPGARPTPQGQQPPQPPTGRIKSWIWRGRRTIFG